MFERVFGTGPYGLSSAAGPSSHIGQQKAERNSTEIQYLERRLDHLVLLNQALWSLLQEKVGLTEEELQARVLELDMRDGKLDGRVESAPAECPNCHRPLSRRHMRCLYCDYTLPLDSFEKISA